MKIFEPKHIVHHPSKPGSVDLIILQPDEDLIHADEDDGDFYLSEMVRVILTSADGAQWEMAGIISEIDDDEPLLLTVELGWGQATVIQP